jgi:hypothetical protein
LNQSDDQAETTFDNPESRQASSVFAYQEKESWIRLALDEEEGVIFLGHQSGLIDMFKYGT